MQTKFPEHNPKVTKMAEKQGKCHKAPTQKHPPCVVCPPKTLASRLSAPRERFGWPSRDRRPRGRDLSPCPGPGGQEDTGGGSRHGVCGGVCLRGGRRRPPEGGGDRGLAGGGAAGA